MEEIVGKLSVVARTGGIQIGEDKKWINPSKDAKQNVLDNLDKIREYKGQTVKVKMEADGTYRGIEVTECIRPNMTPKAEQVKPEGVDWDGKERRDFRSRAVAQLSSHLGSKYPAIEDLFRDAEKIVEFIYKR